MMKTMQLATTAITVLGAAAGSADDACATKDVGAMALLSLKGTDMGVGCEEMCKRIGSYPDCQCAGFAGSPASDDDTRACTTKYCQDPTAPCPNDAFTGCVKENTKVSLLQWDKVFAQVEQGLDALKGSIKMSKEGSSAQACKGKGKDQQQALSALLQVKAADMGIGCEDMCKKIGSYPDCQCAGFAGNPASDGDSRACTDKYCQDPKAPCPNDAFTGCVKENTKVFLQWDKVFAQVSQGLDAKLATMKMAKNVTKK